MNDLNETDLAKISSYFRQGAIDASRALSAWLGREVCVSLNEFQQLSLEMATESLGPSDETTCACCMRFSGGMNGQLLFGFDDLSGLQLCDMLLSQELSATQWGELEISAAMETTNILGCAFLNSLANSITTQDAIALALHGANKAWIPTPPVFVRDFAASIVQFALMDQVCEFEFVLMANTQFSIDNQPIGWRLILIPDAMMLHSFARMQS
jgi:chemotaxis protein CheC